MMNRRAFTLLELVLSMALLSLLLLVALTSVHLGTRLWESGSRTAESGWIKRYFARAFQDAVSSAFPYRSGDKLLFDGRTESLEFVTTSKMYSGAAWGGARLIEYAMEDGRLVVKEKTLPLSDSAFAKTTELSRDIEKISFSFLGSAGWEDEWDGEEKGSLPIAIRVSVVFKDGRHDAEFTAPIMLRTREEGAK